MLYNYSLFFTAAVLCISYAEAYIISVPTFVSLVMKKERTCPSNETPRMHSEDRGLWCDFHSGNDELLEKLNESGCICISGFLRHSNGKCVWAEDCRIDEARSNLNMIIDNILKPTGMEETQQRSICKKRYVKDDKGKRRIVRPCKRRHRM